MRAVTMRSSSRSCSILRTGLLLVACSFPALAGAQQRSSVGPRALSAGLGGGGVVPVGDFANDVKTGWQVSGHVQYQPATEGPWAVRAEALYTRSNLTDDAISAGGGFPTRSGRAAFSTPAWPRLTTSRGVRGRCGRT